MQPVRCTAGRQARRWPMESVDLDLGETRVPEESDAELDDSASTAGPGSPLAYHVDAEIVELGVRFFRDAGLAGVEVHLNSIGDPACRPAYIETADGLLPRTPGRVAPIERGPSFDSNVLRLLDSKDPEMAALNATARRRSPTTYAGLCGPLHRRAPSNALGVPYPAGARRLVSGLDYYSRTAFSLPGRTGGAAAGAGGGGRYDGLVELLGGPPTPGRVRAGPGPGRAGARGEGAARWKRRRGPVAVVGRRRPGRDGDAVGGRHRAAAAGIAGLTELGPPEARQATRVRRRATGTQFAVIVGDGAPGRSSCATCRPAPRRFVARSGRPRDADGGRARRHTGTATGR